ncbi:MAG: mechanosensitive ion channel family protein [Bacteroidetes bacterium]|nr:MAG: mechanosensitive ion channel family protein [Bacteroidota bacterium]TNF00648.1 MAG: mechanosensitive ion channel family protein [Bacteroidota bacterium]
MKEFLSQSFYGNTVQNWLISFGILLGAIIVAKICYWIIGKYVKRITEKTASKLDDLLIDKLEEPIVYAIGILGFYLGFQRLTFGAGVDGFFRHMFTFLFTLNITWLVVRTVDALVEEYIVPLVEKSESDLDDQLMPLIRKLFKAILWSMGIIIGLNNAGFDVAALIAGLGIGGLALALAAQDTVKNIFGGIMVYLDKPFKIADRIVISGHDGVVEEVGIRSTRIRTLEGRQITIPNAQFSESPIENISREPSRKIVLNLGLTYETSPEGMEKAMQMLKEIAEAHPSTEEDILVSFNNWGDFALGILFIYYIKAGEDILQTQTDINITILKRFNAEGLEFAYPTQTIYRK